MKSVELFAGAGGLALGCELAGFTPEVVVEWDKWACDTVRENQLSGYPLVSGWKVHEGDVRDYQWTKLADETVDIVTGGPPCQPFSMGGKARAANDKRDMFPAAIEVIRTLKPRAFILENVRGLTRAAFAEYFHYIQLQLGKPAMTSRPGESWEEHYLRLKEASPNTSSLGYTVTPTLVNAADYGVPQQRHRVFIVGFRNDQDIEWKFPKATHSYDALLYDQWITGDYWDRHKVSPKDRPELNPRLKKRIASLNGLFTPELLPWRTVRDALSDLTEPKPHGSSRYLNHVLQLGAKSYPGHTGSPIDMPAKALKAGGHGVPGGENMLLRPDGSIRYFTIRESARLQTFPDRYELHGSWSEAMRQLGNAVPVLLAQHIASTVAQHLELAHAREAIASSAQNLKIGA